MRRLGKLQELRWDLSRFSRQSGISPFGLEVGRGFQRLGVSLWSARYAPSAAGAFAPQPAQAPAARVAGRSSALDAKGLRFGVFRVR